MRVLDERLSPGVQAGEEADGGAQMLGIGGDGLEGVGRGVKEDRVDDGFVLEREGGDRLRDREDDMKVFTVEEFGGALLDPRGPRERLALGTMAIATRNGELSITCLMESTRFWGARVSSRFPTRDIRSIRRTIYCP